MYENTNEIMKTLEQINSLNGSTRPNEILAKSLKELENINKRLDKISPK